MKALLCQFLCHVVAQARGQGIIKTKNTPALTLEMPKQANMGDFATTLALSLAKEEKRPPMALAESLVSLMKSNLAADPTGLAFPAMPLIPMIEKIEIAGPGYINFFIKKEHWHQTLIEIHRQKEAYGLSATGEGKRVLIEFVSANPTGPLHVAHGRAAALGDVLTRLLRATGFHVDTEYYINDVGGQMTLLSRSTYLRYRELFGETITLPEEGYRGDYIIDIAKGIRNAQADSYLHGPQEEQVASFKTMAYEMIIGWIRRDLTTFGVSFNQWCSEEGLGKAVQSAIAFLQSKGMIYEQEGAIWVATRRYGDDKDRVVVRGNGQITYFASDIAYHKNKLERGYDRLINIWGADHHGYIQRVKAAVTALGYSSDCLTILTHQLVNLLRDGKPVPMSKRSGEFVTLREVMDEVGVDATRFFFLMRRADTAVDFDLELAKRASNENPVYYVQYAYARLCSIVRVAAEKGWDIEETINTATIDDLNPLTLPEEGALIKQLSLYPDLIETTAEMLEPHRLTSYLQELAGRIHKYYYDHRVITEDLALSRARLILVTAIQIVLKNALGIMGVRAPERM